MHFYNLAQGLVLGIMNNVKYSIQINQLALSKSGLDLKECAILDYIKSFCAVDDKKVKNLTIEENGMSYRYTWINFAHLIKEMPLLGIKQKASISERIAKIAKLGFIKTFQAPDRSLYIRVLSEIKKIDFTGDNLKCAWCGTGEFIIMHDHHYPIPKSAGGKKTIKICPPCHAAFHASQGEIKGWGVSQNEQGVSQGNTGELADTNSTSSISSKHNISNKNVAASSAAEIADIIFLFKPVNPLIGKYYGNTSQRAAVERMLKAFGREKLEAAIKALPAVNSKPYWPKSTTPCQLENNIPIYKAKNEEERLKVKENNKVAFL